MPKKVILEELNRDWVQDAAGIDTGFFREKFQEVVEKCRCNMEYFGEKFPSSGGVDGWYKPTENADVFLYSNWTSSFYSGMIWLAYEQTGEACFKDYGLMQLKSFRERYEKNIILDHHDIGFLYSLSCVAAYKLTGDDFAKETALLAAKKLAGRFRKEVGVIQRGGSLTDYNDQHCGAYIVDCCLNVPLLFWAADITGNREWHDMAVAHLQNVLKHTVREDGSVYQYVKLDVKNNGAVLKAHSPQGADVPGSCWSRGQAWAVYGLALAYRYTGDPAYLEYGKYVTNYFLNRLQSDFTSNWDFLYTDDADQRDTSATAITVCGLLEMVKHLPVNDPLRKQYEAAAIAITRSLIDHYMYQPGESNGVLKGGVYSFNTGHCVNEPVIWGDYYFMEALARFCFVVRIYW